MLDPTITVLSIFSDLILKEADVLAGSHADHFEAAGILANYLQDVAADGAGGAEQGNILGHLFTCPSLYAEYFEVEQIEQYRCSDHQGIETVKNTAVTGQDIA